MSKQSPEQKTILSGIGKFGTLSELLKRNLKVQITFANKSNTNKLTTGNINHMRIQVIYPDGTEKYIKVKTSRSERFVTGWQKYRHNNCMQPDYWVIVHIDTNNISHYHILTHEELGTIQINRNEEACANQNVHTENNDQEASYNGVDNVLLEHIAESENRWDKIVDHK